jgi:hypothetical protein
MSTGFPNTKFFASCITCVTAGEDLTALCLGLLIYKMAKNSFHSLGLRGEFKGM